MLDPYADHPLVRVPYVSGSVPTAATQHLFDEVFADGCGCRGACSERAGCRCLLRFGRRYEAGRLRPAAGGVYECHGRCSCAADCGNRVVQHGPSGSLDVRRCGARGLGVFAREPVPRGAFVCEYAGEVLAPQEARLRYRLRGRAPNYIFCLREHFGDAVSTTFVDPTRLGNVGRYLNHSCDPNCEPVPVRVAHAVPRVCLFARRDVPANQELTFDYGGGEEAADSLTPCECGAARCRGWMPRCPDLD